MKHISSRDNPLYKRLMRLARGKREKGADAHAVQHVLLEGVHLCQAWLQHAGAPELALFDLRKLETQAELQSLANRLPAGLCHSCEPGLAAGLSQVEHGQGVYFLATAPTPVLPERIAHNCLWLDRLQDPGNVGTLLRTAAAAGIEHAYLSTACASVWSAKVLRSAQGAHFVMTIHEHVDLMALRRRLAIPLVATALDDAQPLYDAPLPAKCAWVFGNEGQGVDPSLLEQADMRVFIPQVAEVESLNVAVAAGVCLFEQRREHSQEL
ncbi:TrmH family RNA methyltransferase [Pollutimonas harenae]|uniref:RNA methyltransferase n=1 Tax=Pollutimonas harenae TaxID=657015 RepID=A0A853H178_9BURK|nr:RNA methyltransferase [Pollutimonas harenae]NYT86062.1 RNA methyltransferase [Pollutimonas harenae]TEA71109.1 RNA methyltransferase [Pollutimonas harenae]